ncbi:MAG: hypothetical protein ACI36W_05990 [Coriobacteriales bacterium]
MSQDIPRNKIKTAASAPVRDDAALEAEWLANNVPAERLELHWRYESGVVQLYERRLRSLAAYGVGPALRSYLRTRLEWFCDNKLYAQPRGIVVVTVETNGDVDMQLGDPAERPLLSDSDLLWNGDELSGAQLDGTLFARCGDRLAILGSGPLRDACECFAADLSKTLAHSLGYQLSQLAVTRSELSSCELLLVNEELGELPFRGHEGPYVEKMRSCFNKLWSTGKQ